MLNGTLKGRFLPGSVYRSFMREILTIKNTIKIMKFAIFATVVMSPRRRNRLEKHAIPKIAVQGVLKKWCTRAKIFGSEPASAMPYTILDPPSITTSTVFVVEKRAIQDRRTKALFPRETAATSASGISEIPRT